MKQTESFHTTENMERISRQHLCDNLDSILETVSQENIGFVITDAGKDDLVLCPASWLSPLESEEFGCIVNSAVRYSLGRDTYMPGIAVQFILEYMNLFDLRTVTVMYRDIQKALEDENLPHRETWVSLMYALETRLKRKE
jgi:hypothetical protein|nr:MAG TPA: antitoxin [Caudoviricetes sp.]